MTASRFVWILWLWIMGSVLLRIHRLVFREIHRVPAGWVGGCVGELYAATGSTKTQIDAINCHQI